MEKPQTCVERPPSIKLSKSASNTVLSNPTELAKVKMNLSKSCFGVMSNDKKPLDLDLTNLNWLQNNNLLKGIHNGAKRGCLSPLQDMDLTFIPGTQINGGGPKHASSPKMNLPNAKNTPRKPPYSFSSLIFMAIEDSSNKKLPVKDIYNWITERFPYFRNAPLGWKNSVRHNLSLNKCFKKVDKDKGQAMGKGSLWCVDPEYRPNLMQALRKTPSFHPYGGQWTTPPPSPQSSNGSATKALESQLLQSITQSGRHTPNVDPEAEAEAAATMCLMGGASDIDRNPSKTKLKKGYKSSFSDLLSVAASLEKAQRQSKGKQRRISDRISPSSSMDSEYEFDRSDTEDEDHENEAMETLIKKDALEDSGYGEKTARPNGGNQDDDIVGADALLELASKACIMKPLSVASSEASDSS